MIESENTNFVNNERGWVRVTNIASDAPPEEIKNLFGFCGFISAFDIKIEEDGTQTAIIEFWEKSAVTTACLLSNAVIRNKLIQVSLHLITNEEYESLQKNKSTDKPPEGVDPVAKQNKTAVVAQLFAKGYILADDVKNKAISWDTGNLNIKLKLEALGAVALQHAAAINEKYALTDKKDEFLALAAEKAKELEAILQSNRHVQTGIAKAKELDEKYHVVDSAVSFIETVKRKGKEILDETESEIAKKKAERERLNQAGSAPSLVVQNDQTRVEVENVGVTVLTQVDNTQVGVTVPTHVTVDDPQ